MLTHEPDGALAERGIDFLWHDAILSTRKDAAPNLRRFSLNINSFYSLLHARVVISDWKHEYNHERRHSSLGYLAPVEYARSCTHTFEETDSHTERT